MSTVLNIRNNCTVYVKLLPVNGLLPRRFCLIRNNDKQELYFERYLNGNTPRIKFNVVEGGEFITNTPVELIKIIPIEIPDIKIDLPPYERNREKEDIDIVLNKDLKGTPARIFTLGMEKGLIEKSPAMLKYPKPMQKFFLLHEMGHQYYKTEKYCDLFAFVHFLKMGYNMSTAMYCLTKVLKRSPQNNDRIMFIYNTILKRNGNYYNRYR